MKLRRPLGMWQRLAAVLAALWVTGYSVYAYFGIARGRDEQLRVATLHCPTREPACISEYMSSWTAWGDFVFAVWAVGIAVGFMLALWLFAWVVFATVKWIWAGRNL